MIGYDDIQSILEDYDRLKLRIGMTASHSALDICDGAIEEGFPTVAYCQKGREKRMQIISVPRGIRQEGLSGAWSIRPLYWTHSMM